MTNKIGVYCSSNKPDLWIPVYNMLSKSRVELEFMFVGDVEPNFDLPKNMKWINSAVKPSQCYYIAATRVDGNYLFNIPDDCTYNNGCLDTLLERMLANDVSKTITTPRYQKHPQDFWGGGQSNIMLPVGSLCSRDVWNRYSIDKNFIALYWDVDMAMSLYSDGGKTIICEEATICDDRFCQRSTWNSFGRHDISYFYSLWTSGSEILFTRTIPRQNNFQEIPSILEFSQGEKGKWI